MLGQLEPTGADVIAAEAPFQGVLCPQVLQIGFLVLLSMFPVRVISMLVSCSFTLRQHLSIFHAARMSLSFSSICPQWGLLAPVPCLCALIRGASRPMPRLMFEFQTLL